MRRAAVFAILILAGAVAFGAFVGKRVYAQAITSASPYSFTVTGTLANCPAVSTIASGSAGYCFTNTGLAQSVSGSAWTILGGAAAAPTLTLNGVQKTLPASFTIAASAPAVSTTATAAAPTVTTN